MDRCGARAIDRHVNTRLLAKIRREPRWCRTKSTASTSGCATSWMDVELPPVDVPQAKTPNPTKASLSSRRRRLGQRNAEADRTQGIRGGQVMTDPGKAALETWRQRERVGRDRACCCALGGVGLASQRSVGGIWVGRCVGKCAVRSGAAARSTARSRSGAAASSRVTCIRPKLPLVCRGPQASTLLAGLPLALRNSGFPPTARWSLRWKRRQTRSSRFTTATPRQRKPNARRCSTPPSLICSRTGSPSMAQRSR